MINKLNSCFLFYICFRRDLDEQLRGNQCNCENLWFHLDCSCGVDKSTHHVHSQIFSQKEKSYLRNI